MKLRPFLLPSVTCLAGFALAWAVKPSVDPVVGGPVGREPGDSRPRMTKIARSANPDAARNARVNDALKRYADAGYQKDKKQAVLSEIGNAEFLPLIEALTREAGMTGLDYSQKQMLEEFLAEWSERDPGAALAWIVGLKNPKDRRELLGTYIGKLAEKDLGRAVELLSQYGRDEKGDWDLPLSLGKHIVSQDVDTMLRLVGRFTTKGGKQFLPIGTYASGYDFRKALDGLVAMKATLRPGEELAVVPGNLISEWTLRDPTAAWQWLGEGKVLTWASNDMSVYLKSYATVGNAGDVARFFADAAPRYGSQEQYYYEAFNLFSAQKNPELFTRWLVEMPGDRLDKLGRLFSATKRGIGGEYDDFKNSFVSQLSSEERVRVFESSFKNGCAESERQFYQPLLRRLGHSDEQIRTMLPEQAVKP